MVYGSESQLAHYNIEYEKTKHGMCHFDSKLNHEDDIFIVRETAAVRVILDSFSPQNKKHKTLRLGTEFFFQTFAVLLCCSAVITMIISATRLNEKYSINC